MSTSSASDTGLQTQPWKLALGSVGVVYGDIGTSPIYALREGLQAASSGGLSPDEVVGIVSLLLWTLILIVTLKYVILILRADNRGEGGTLSLLALAERAVGRRTGLLLALGILGTALFFGDAIITPAISVLSAIEGLTLVTPAFEPYVLPITLGILFALFWVQSRGTGSVSALFGPVMLGWFLMMGGLGLWHIGDHPDILAALNPAHAGAFLVSHGAGALPIIAAVFLAVTGAEALYADMGHFGKRPIRLAWSAVVLPALVINYFGQGAMVLADPTTADNPFYRMAPSWAVVPLVVLATVATVIASQALISGAFSITTQAIQLGLLPRMRIDHTSTREYGQVYIGVVNYGLFFAAVALVVGFGSSQGLAAAYGIAVTMTMVITAVLLAAVMAWRWQWPRWRIALVVGVFLLADLAFFGANIIKIRDGGWVPLAVGLVVAGVMLVWQRERNAMQAAVARREPTLERFIGSLSAHPQLRVKGTAVYLVRQPALTPAALIANLRHNEVLHERVLVVTVQISTAPTVLPARRVTWHEMGEGFHSIVLHYGFDDRVDVPHDLANFTQVDFAFDDEEATYFLGTDVVEVRGRGWRRLPTAFFARLHRNTWSPARYFGLPPEQVVEFGGVVEL